MESILTNAEIYQGLQADLTIDAMRIIKRWQPKRRKEFIRRKMRRIHARAAGYLCPHCFCRLTPSNTADKPLCKQCDKEERKREESLCSCGREVVEPDRMFCRFCLRKKKNV